MARIGLHQSAQASRILMARLDRALLRRGVPQQTCLSILASPRRALCACFAPAQSQTDSSLIVTIDSGALEGAHLGAADELMFLGATTT